MKKTTKVVEVVDDLDGSPADQTVRFAFNGASYEIDLNRAHFEEFAEAMRATRTSAWRTRRSVRGRRGRASMFLIVVAFPLRLSRRTVRRMPDRYMSSGGAGRPAPPDYLVGVTRRLRWCYSHRCRW